MKDGKKKFVQAVPFGKKIKSSRIKVDEEGRVHIKIANRYKTIVFKDLTEAVKEFLDYEEFYKNEPKGAQSFLWRVRGREEWEFCKWNSEIIFGLGEQKDNFFNTLEKFIPERSSWYAKMKRAKVIIEELFSFIYKKYWYLEWIKTSVSERLKELREEQKRCKSIIKFNVDQWIYVYSILEETPENKKTEKKIKWDDFLDGLRKLYTVKVNPYRDRIHCKEVRNIEKIPLLLEKGEMSKARRLLEKSILKLLLLIYPDNRSHKENKGGEK